ncbi:MAG TPA: hypothetical protein DEP35_19420 [Deltaproteobacteria bacterium]|nr:hypothetical protein [Deltaproteobacteria bacterium]
MARSIAYPALNFEEARAHARADAEENGWAVVETRWHPRFAGEGGVLVVLVDEAPPSQAVSVADPAHRIDGRR